MMTNYAVWWIGADDGSTGFEVILEQRDQASDAPPEFSPLFRVEAGGDAMGIGMMIGSLDRHHALGSHWYHSAHDPRP